MAQTIKLKRSATSGAAPSTSDLALGEVAINTYDGKMYIKKSVGGTESIVEIGGVGSVGNPTKLDEITTVNGQAAYSLTVNSTSYTPTHVNAMIVSVNGVTQEPGDSFTISESTITFSPALATGDVIDYIVDMGRTVTIASYATVDDATALAIALG
tara:strand:- start:1427 stop:1894 length:468 start_codon:yes stop_codon:yes gene_type:complete